MSEIKLFADMQVKTQPVAAYHLRKDDLIVLDNLIYRITTQLVSYPDPIFYVEPAWALETNREASGVAIEFRPEGDTDKVVLTY